MTRQIVIKGDPSYGSEIHARDEIASMIATSLGMQNIKHVKINNDPMNPARPMQAWEYYGNVGDDKIQVFVSNKCAMILKNGARVFERIFADRRQMSIYENLVGLQQDCPIAIEKNQLAA